MTIQELSGQYTIIGTNQNESSSEYTGSLSLSVDENHRVLAKWYINNSQFQMGTGFLKNNILVLNFNYIGEDNLVYKGVVFYKCLSKDILEGFWSEEEADPKYLGSENCFRINTEIVN